MPEIKVNTKELYHWNISVNSQEKMAIITGLPSKAFSGKALGDVKTKPGYIYKNESLTEWMFEEMGEVEGEILFWGPPLTLIPLSDESPLTLEELKGINALFSALYSDGYEGDFSQDCFYRIDGGGLFCFPSGLMSKIHVHKTDRHLLSRERFNRQELSGEDRLSHAMAVLIFHSITGVFPYSCTESEEWIHQEIRKKPIPPLSKNGIEHQDLVDGVKRAFRGKDLPSLPCWSDILVEATEFQGQMNENYRTALERATRGFIKDFNGRKNQTRNRFITVLICGALFFTYQGVKSYMAPPFTEGLNQAEVVELFYQSVTQMDLVAIISSTEKDLGSRVSNQVGMLYVIEKSRQSISAAGTVSPEEWRERDFEPLPEGINVFGVEKLNITPLGNDSFKVDYTIWYPPIENPENIGQEVDPYDIRRVVELVQVIRDKRDRSWIIGSIEQERSEQIPSAIYLKGLLD